MGRRRKADGRKAVIHFRTERMEEYDGQWYFHTREGTIQGPYEDELDAQIALENYLRLIDSGLFDEGAGYRVDVRDAS